MAWLVDGVSDSVGGASVGNSYVCWALVEEQVE